jgi:hypothetical protein
MIIKYLDKHGVGKIASLIKNATTGIYTVKGRAIFADSAFLALSNVDKEAVSEGASAIVDVGLYQNINDVWTLIDSFEEGYVYDIINDFTSTSDFVEGAGHTVESGTNIVVVNTGTKATPVLKYDLFSGILNLTSFQTKSLTEPLTVFENTTPTVYTSSASLPTEELIESATIESYMVAIIGGSSTEAGDVYRAYVETDSEDSTKNSITWVKLGDQQTVEGAIAFLGNTCPNTPISDDEIDEIWDNA